jgi:hypothetical protein
MREATLGPRRSAYCREEQLRRAVKIRKFYVEWFIGEEENITIG